MDEDDEDAEELEPSLFDPALELSLFEPESVLAAVEPESDFDSDFVEDTESLLEPPRPFAELDDERESVMYQPLPLKTMPTGWITLRSAPPHCSHVLSGGSEKLWRFSVTSSQAVHL